MASHDLGAPSEDYCAHLGLRAEDTPIAQGRLSVEEGLVLFTYVGTIALMLKGPSHLLGRRWTSRGQEPPWYTEKTVYAPVIGLIFLSLVSFFRGKTYSLVTGRAVRETLAAKVPIILLIQSFAYLSISLDISGFFKEAAARMVERANGDGHRLLVYTYALCSILTYFTSNDIVILSMTPLIMHVGDCSSIRNVIPLLITQYIAANTSAMGLLVGSPTNIILGDAIDLSFSRYWVLMLLPTVVAIALTLVMILAVFVWLPTRGNVMPRRFSMTAGGGAATVAGVTTTSRSNDGDKQQQQQQEEGGGLENLEVPEAGGIEMLADASVLRPSSSSPPPPPPPPPPASELEAAEQQASTLMTAPKTRRAKVLVFFTVLVLLSLANFIHAELWAISFISALVMLGIDLGICHHDNHSKLSFLTQIYHRIPWAIAPFVLCMFILVRVLTDTGFTGRFAKGMITAAGSSVWSQSQVYGLVSSLLVNVLNDLPSTVCWSSMLPLLCQSYSPRSFHVVIQALLVGVNPGCYLTILGALAGIMWISLINSHPASKTGLVTPTAFDLSYYGTLVLLPVVVVTCCAISLQSYAY